MILKTLLRQYGNLGHCTFLLFLVKFTKRSLSLLCVPRSAANLAVLNACIVFSYLSFLGVLVPNASGEDDRMGGEWKRPHWWMCFKPPTLTETFEFLSLNSENFPSSRDYVNTVFTVQVLCLRALYSGY